MTLAEQHGFAFFNVPGGASNPLVLAFAEAHFREAGYPPGTRPSSTKWVAVCEPDESQVWAVFGWRYLYEMKITSFDDLYARKGRRGTLAIYAALERIKADAERTNLKICTPTPAWNTRMLAAVARYFGPHELCVTVYDPLAAKKATVEEVAPALVAVGG